MHQLMRNWRAFCEGNDKAQEVYSERYDPQQRSGSYIGCHVCSDAQQQRRGQERKTNPEKALARGNWSALELKLLCRKWISTDYGNHPADRDPEAKTDKCNGPN